MGKIIGVFEDEYGLIPADPGRMIYVNNIPPSPPLPAIPSGTFQPPSNPIFLSIATPVYVNQISYNSGVSILATYTFLGYTMQATYAFQCGSTSSVVSVPSMFINEQISWYDKDKSVKSTPSNPALMEIPLPLLTGNHVDNPHIEGDDIVVKTESGKRFIIRGAACALDDEIDDAAKAIDDIFNSGAHCFYGRGDVDGYNKNN